jgi:hypothetical protein
MTMTDRMTGIMPAEPLPYSETEECCILLCNNNYRHPPASEVNARFSHHIVFMKSEIFWYVWEILLGLHDFSTCRQEIPTKC